MPSTLNQEFRPDSLVSPTLNNESMSNKKNVDKKPLTLEGLKKNLLEKIDQEKTEKLAQSSLSLRRKFEQIINPENKQSNYLFKFIHQKNSDILLDFDTTQRIVDELKKTYQDILKDDEQDGDKTFNNKKEFLYYKYLNAFSLSDYLQDLAEQIIQRIDDEKKQFQNLPQELLELKTSCQNFIKKCISQAFNEITVGKNASAILDKQINEFWEKTTATKPLGQILAEWGISNKEITEAEKIINTNKDTKKTLKETIKNFLKNGISPKTIKIIIALLIGSSYLLAVNVHPAYSAGDHINIGNNSIGIGNADHHDHQSINNQNPNTEHHNLKKTTKHKQEDSNEDEDNINIYDDLFNKYSDILFDKPYNLLSQGKNVIFTHKEKQIFNKFIKAGGYDGWQFAMKDYFDLIPKAGSKWFPNEKSDNKFLLTEWSEDYTILWGKEIVLNPSLGTIKISKKINLTSIEEKIQAQKDKIRDQLETKYSSIYIESAVTDLNNFKEPNFTSTKAEEIFQQVWKSYSIKEYIESLNNILLNLPNGFEIIPANSSGLFLENKANNSFVLLDKNKDIGQEIKVEKTSQPIKFIGSPIKLEERKQEVQLKKQKQEEEEKRKQQEEEEARAKLETISEAQFSLSANHEYIIEIEETNKEGNYSYPYLGVSDLIIEKCSNPVMVKSKLLEDGSIEISVFDSVNDQALFFKTSIKRWRYGKKIIFFPALDSEKIKKGFRLQIVFFSYPDYRLAKSFSVISQSENKQGEYKLNKIISQKE